MPASAWPPYYPPLSGVVERARPGRQPLPVASEEDRLLILAADAVTGRPVEKLTRRMRPLLKAPGVSGFSSREMPRYPAKIPPTPNMKTATSSE